MKKKILVIIMAATLALTGCGAKKTAEDAAATAASSEVTVEAETASDTEPASTGQTTDSGPAASTQTTGSESKSDDTKAEASSDSSSAAASKTEESTAAASKSSTADQAKASSNDKSSEAKPAQSDADTTTKAAEAPAQTETQTQPEAPAQPETPPQPAASQKTDYGRILFVGDSRSVDLFYSDRSGIYGEVHDGITVYAEDARSYKFLIETMGVYDTSNFDTLVSWMGCNDYGNFSNYQPHYEGLLREGKTLVLCTVGPTLDEGLNNDFDRANYTNDHEIAYNNSLWAWANANGVKVIDLYSYLSNTSDVYIDPNDGIHYQPQPTSVIWSVILSSLN